MRDRGNEPGARDRPQRTYIKSRSSLPFIKIVAALLRTFDLTFCADFAEAVRGFTYRSLDINTDYLPRLHPASVVH